MIRTEKIEEKLDDVSADKPVEGLSKNAVIWRLEGPLILKNAWICSARIRKCPLFLNTS